MLGGALLQLGELGQDLVVEVGAGRGEVGGGGQCASVMRHGFRSLEFG
ncbi:hypothetical protein ABR737_41095 [Streptomyces sp. Edi2]